MGKIMSYMAKTSHDLDLLLPASVKEEVFPTVFRSIAGVEELTDPSERTLSEFLLEKADGPFSGREGLPRSERDPMTVRSQVIESHHVVCRSTGYESSSFSCLFFLMILVWLALL